MRGKLLIGATVVFSLAGCGSTSASHSGTRAESSSAASSTTRTTTPQINTAKLTACLKIATDLQAIGSDLSAMQTAMRGNGDTIGSATKLTQDVDTAEPDVAALRTLVAPNEQSAVDEESSVFSQWASAAQHVAAGDLQTGLENLISANGAQQSFNQQIGQICKLTK